MTNEEIIAHVSKWFGNEMSPGQVFDDLVDLRHRSVTWEALCSAIMEQGVEQGMVAPARPVKSAPRSAPKSSLKFAGAMPSEFKNPAPVFGPYKGKTLLEIIKINPGYVATMAADSDGNFGAFWANQAKLAQLHAQAKAPAYKDTDPGGFLQ